MQRGSTGGIFLAAFGVLVITIWGGYYFFREEPQASPPQLLQDVPLGDENVRKTRSFVVLDNNFAYAGGRLYFRTGSASDGEPLYSIMPVSDPESFEKIGSAVVPARSSGTSLLGGSGSTYAQSAYSGASSQPNTQSSPETAPSTVQSGGTTALGSAYGTGSPEYSVSYYSDGQNVYMVVESGGVASVPQVVIGADPATFEVLNAEYAKDDTHVYVVIVTCIGGSCSATISIVASADPDTFQAFPNAQNVLNSDCTGYVVADGQDANNVYNNGQIVDGVSVYMIGENGSCDDTPVLISP